MTGVGSLALGIVQSDDWGFSDLRTIAALIAAHNPARWFGQTITQFTQEPILYVPLFSNHDFRVGSTLSFFLAGNFTGSFLAFRHVFARRLGVVACLKPASAYRLDPGDWRANVGCLWSPRRSFRASHGDSAWIAC